MLHGRPNVSSQLSHTSYGLVVEGGYSFSAPLGVSLGNEAAGDDDLDREIDLVGASLGDVARSGPMLRIGAVMRL